jgi:hypothetical protein
MSSSVDWSDVTAKPEPTPCPELFVRQPTAAESETAKRVEQVQVPQRDLVELARRLGGKPDLALAVTGAQPPGYELGDSLGFWVLDEGTTSYFTATATLQYATPHAYWWVQDSYDVPSEDLEDSAEHFETKTYPTNRRLFGGEPNPGVDGDPHIYIFLGNVPGVGGYFSSEDAFPASVSEHSNQHEMFYISLDNAMPGSSYFDGILAHELQHVSQWVQDRNEDTWVNEGLSEVAVQLNGYTGGGSDDAYRMQPDTQLTTWPEIEGSGAHYGASLLFTSYFVGRYGEEKLASLVVQPANGMAGFDAVLGGSEGDEHPADTLFADWVVATYLDDPQAEGGRHALQGLRIDPPAAAASYDTYPVHAEATVHQYGADYIELAGMGDVTVSFTGSLVVPLVGCQPHSGDFYWWSNRGDDSDVTLTRGFDLTGLQQATLHAWMWYHLEADYDYGYVEVSADGGGTWDMLAGAHTTTVNPMGASYGPAFTGISGGGDTPAWVEQTFDLSRHAGRQVLIRFEVIYDDALNYPGICLDDISIPELAYVDDAEQAADGWDAAGWLRATAYVPQKFVVQLLTSGQSPRVQRLALDTTMRGSVQVKGLGQDIDRAVLVVSGLTRATTERAGYRYRVVSP